MKISCVAIDDEPLALDLLSKFIQQTTFLELAGKFSNAIEALGYINQHEVNLIFMDIQMPDLSGMELARILDGKKNSVHTRVVFCTAYHQFALEGYKVEALDYLLKPYSYEDFLAAATKAYQYFGRIGSSSSSSTSTTQAPATDYIFLKVEYQLIKVVLKDITHVEAYKDYVKVHLKSKNHPLLSLTSMKNMEELLPKDRFMRVHRSFIVSLDHIDSISKNVIHIGGQQIAVGDLYKDQFSEFVGRWTS
ncbi:MAG: response regulator transcription factor [Bacteroidetes bacterium]|nr:response regulator transcription factor [Bacteroidota bacterium]